MHPSMAAAMMVPPQSRTRMAATAQRVLHRRRRGRMTWTPDKENGSALGGAGTRTTAIPIGTTRSRMQTARRKRMTLAVSAPALTHAMRKRPTTAQTSRTARKVHRDRGSVVRSLERLRLTARALRVISLDENPRRTFFKDI